MNSAENTSDTWRGPSYHELFNGFDEFHDTNQAPSVEESESHTVLFNLPLPDNENEYPVPYRSGEEDKWNNDFVKLPSSPSSIYFEIDEDGIKEEKLRWDLIKSSLLDKEIRNVEDLETAIKTYSVRSVQESEFTALNELFEDVFSDEDSEFFFNEVLPKIIQLALRLPQLIQSPIPLLQQKMNHSISLSQEQAGCLLANAFLCTFPKRSMGRKYSDYPEINFNGLFDSDGSHVMQKLKCILNYLKRICHREMPKGVLTFQRRYIEPSRYPKRSDSDAKFSSMKFSMSSDKKIEEGSGMLQVDFANRYLGGGVLGWGCVQEEIRFAINPEMIVGMLFCEAMRTEEAILMTGCEQFNKYTGYSNSFQWRGSFIDKTPCDSFRRKKSYVVAIDALCFHKPNMQFEEFALKREMCKAFVGFTCETAEEKPPVPVCSGNWGCGAFRGNKHLKALIQLMVCCINRRNLLYCTFDEKDLVDEVYDMFEFLTRSDISVGSLWDYLKAYNESRKSNSQPLELYPFIYQEHQKRVACKELLNGVTFDDEINPPQKKQRIVEQSEEISSLPPSEHLDTSNYTSAHEETSCKNEDREKLVETNSEDIKREPVTQKQFQPSSSEALRDSPKIRKTKITDFFKRKI